jgi:hypothetical protein
MLAVAFSCRVVQFRARPDKLLGDKVPEKDEACRRCDQHPARRSKSRYQVIRRRLVQRIRILSASPKEWAIAGPFRPPIGEHRRAKGSRLERVATFFAFPVLFSFSFFFFQRSTNWAGVASQRGAKPGVHGRGRRVREGGVPESQRNEKVDRTGRKIATSPLLVLDRPTGLSYS